MKRIRDQIADQVTSTYMRVKQYRSMIEILRESVSQAGSGLEKNLAAIKGLEGLPLEAITSLEQLGKARSEYLAAVINYNQWQIRLLRAAGQSLAADAKLGTIANCHASNCSGCTQCELVDPELGYLESKPTLESKSTRKDAELGELQPAELDIGISYLETNQMPPRPEFEDSASAN